MRKIMVWALFWLISIIGLAGCGVNGNNNQSTDTGNNSDNADVSGYWSVTHSEVGSGTDIWSLSQSGNTVHGSFICGGTASLSGTVSGSNVALIINDTINLAGSLSGNNINGSYSSQIGSPGTWNATKLSANPCPSSTTFTPYNLFPAKLNSTWTYDNGKTVKVTSYSESNGKAYATISNNSGGGSVDLVLSNMDVQISGFTNPDYIMVAYYFAQNPLIKVPLSLGTSWTDSSSWTGSTSNGYPINMTTTVTSTTSSVTIGTTTYDNCVEVTLDIAYPNGYDWTTWLTNRKLYFYPNIGCIKRVDTWSDNSVTSINLTSYNIP